MKNRITSPVLEGIARAMCHDVGICKSHRAMYGNCICNHKRDTAAPGEGPLWTFGLPEAHAVLEYLLTPDNLANLIFEYWKKTGQSVDVFSPVDETEKP